MIRERGEELANMFKDNYELAKRKLSDAETNIQSVMGEMYKYVSSHTESGNGEKQ